MATQIPTRKRFFIQRIAKKKGQLATSAASQSSGAVPLESLRNTAEDMNKVSPVAKGEAAREELRKRRRSGALNRSPLDA